MTTLGRFGLLVGASLLASIAAAATKPITLAYKLPKKTPEVKPALLEALSAGPFRVDVVDARGGSDPAIVGSQTEKGEELYAWRATQPVAPAVAGFAREVLRGWSLQVEAEAGTTLNLKLLRYWVDEKSMTFGSKYVAEVKLEVSLANGGVVAWTREATGTSKRDGVDARPAICNEGLSLALRDALVQALGSAPAEVVVAPAAAAIPAGLPLFDALVRLKMAGASDDAIVTYVREHKPPRPLTVDEILAWKNAGLPDAAIKAASE